MVVETKLGNLSEPEFAEHVGSGQLSPHEAFEELYRRYARRVLAFIAARCPYGIDAEDIAQETWLTVDRKWHSFDGNNPCAWIFTIARSRLLDTLRKRRSWQLTENIDIADDSWELDEDDRLLALRECLEKLDSIFIQTLRAKLAGTSIQDIAQSEKINETTVSSRCNRAYQQLGTCVEQKIK